MAVLKKRRRYRPTAVRMGGVAQKGFRAAGGFHERQNPSGLRAREEQRADVREPRPNALVRQ